MATTYMARAPAVTSYLGAAPRAVTTTPAPAVTYGAPGVTTTYGGSAVPPPAPATHIEFPTTAVDRTLGGPVTVGMAHPQTTITTAMQAPFEVAMPQQSMVKVTPQPATTVTRPQPVTTTTVPQPMTTQVVTYLDFAHEQAQLDKRKELLKHALLANELDSAKTESGLTGMKVAMKGLASQVAAASHPLAPVGMTAPGGEQVARMQLVNAHELAKAELAHLEQELAATHLRAEAATIDVLEYDLRQRKKVDDETRAMVQAQMEQLAAQSAAARAQLYH